MRGGLLQGERVESGRDQRPLESIRKSTERKRGLGRKRDLTDRAEKSERERQSVELYTHTTCIIRAACCVTCLARYCDSHQSCPASSSSNTSRVVRSELNRDEFGGATTYVCVCDRVLCGCIAAEELGRVPLLLASPPAAGLIPLPGRVARFSKLLYVCETQTSGKFTTLQRDLCSQADFRISGKSSLGIYVYVSLFIKPPDSCVYINER